VWQLYVLHVLLESCGDRRASMVRHSVPTVLKSGLSTCCAREAEQQQSHDYGVRLFRLPPLYYSSSSSCLHRK